MSDISILGPNSIKYLASPYTHKHDIVMRWRYEQVCIMAASLIKAGHIIYCPIAHSFHIAEILESDKYTKKGDTNFWMKQDIPMLDVIHELYVYMLPDWDKSDGITKEIEHMKWLERPISYIHYNPGDQILITASPHG